MSNKPGKHHYLPVFYLKRWATKGDRRLCEFSRPYGGIIKPRRVHPEGTGYLHHLYSMRSQPPELAQQVEEKFYQPVDNAASDALDAMEKLGNDVAWTGRLRSGWTTFLMSMMLRMPEDLAIFKERWRKELFVRREEFGIEYQKRRTQGDPPTFEEYMALAPEEIIEKGLFDSYTYIQRHKEIGARINNMHWYIIKKEHPKFSFLTSDRGIIRLSGIDKPDALIALPIGPMRLFVACNRSAIAHGLSQLPPRELIKRTNLETVQHAVKFAYGIDDGQIPFVRKYFGTAVQRRLADGILSRGTGGSPA